MYVNIFEIRTNKYWHYRDLSTAERKEEENSHKKRLQLIFKLNLIEM